MRIYVSQINSSLGDFEGNAQKILSEIAIAHDRRCDLVLFPECALFGYHPFDLLERKELVEAQVFKIKQIHKKIPNGMAVVLGAITLNKAKTGRPYFNSAVVLEKGKPVKIFNKQLLPTGDVFNEGRFFESGEIASNVFKYKGKSLLVTICEDIWAWPNKSGKSIYKKNPLKNVKTKIDLVLNLSASPFYLKKEKLRKEVIVRTAKYFKAPVIYCNLVGAQDELIFDGSSVVFDKNGKEHRKAQSFVEDHLVIDESELSSARKSLHLNEAEQLRRALVLGISDFCNKTGLKKIHLGMSGGIDSALVACLAVDALGASRVTGIAMPGPFSDKISLELAAQQARLLGINFIQAPISDSYAKVLSEISEKFAISEFGITNENLQARLRGLFLMAYSNQNGSLLLSTSNKSEYSTGYSTLYGDMCGGLAPIGDLLKGQVYEIAKLYNQEIELIPSEVLERPPTAELRPNQKDQDSLPAYNLLDQSVAKIVACEGKATTATDRWLMPVLLRTEFKRWQAPPILKVSDHAFGRGRHWPIAKTITIK
jgi:NAD+ synthase (glutamine-hydrolysing)